jgi:Na+/H+ antiporter NhaD/arsenite permease-like protein
MRRRIRELLAHPAVRTLLFERFLITGSATLAFSALAMGHVQLSEIPGLMDLRILTLFLVLTVAVELGKASDLFDRLVVVVIRHVRSARGLALAMIAVTAFLSCILTNDVTLFLVVPFTMLFRDVEGAELHKLVVLEVLAANLLGALTPIGNPQNLFLYARGGFTFGSFVQAQIPPFGASVVLLAAVVFVFIPQRQIVPPATAAFDVDPTLTAGFFLLLAAELGSLFGRLPYQVPLLLALPAALLLGRRLRDVDFSIVLVFALLFIGVPGLERGRLYHRLDPGRIFGHRAVGLLLSGTLLSQVVSNVPAALLLAPAAASPLGFRGLLYGVTAGACGSPIGSIANLIGAQIYVAQGGERRSFWLFFLGVSCALLIVLVVFAALLLRLDS